MFCGVSYYAGSQNFWKSRQKILSCVGTVSEFLSLADHFVAWNVHLKWELRPSARLLEDSAGTFGSLPCFVSLLHGGVKNFLLFLYLKKAHRNRTKQPIQLKPR